MIVTSVSIFSYHLQATITYIHNLFNRSSVKVMVGAAISSNSLRIYTILLHQIDSFQCIHNFSPKLCILIQEMPLPVQPIPSLLSSRKEQKTPPSGL